MKYTIAGIVLLIAFGLAHADAITACNNAINVSGIYTASNDLSSVDGGYCFDIQTSDVVVDLNGKILNLTSGRAFGNPSGYSNLTFENGIIALACGIGGAYTPTTGALLYNIDGNNVTFTNITTTICGGNIRQGMIYSSGTNPLYFNVSDSIFNYEIDPDGGANAFHIIVMEGNGNSTVSGNQFNTTGGDGSCYIIKDTGEDVSYYNAFSNNYVSFAACQLLLTTSVYPTIHGNTIADFDSSGCPSGIILNYRDVDDKQNATIDNNYIRFVDCGGEGITTNSVPNVNLTNNIMISPAQYTGYTFTGDTNVYLYNSTYTRGEISGFTTFQAYWWFDVNVSDLTTNAPIVGAVVNLTSLDPSLQSEVTGADGIAHFTVLEYSEVSGVGTNHTPHDINVTATDYFDNSTSMEIRQSEMLLILMNSTMIATPTPTPAPTAAPVQPGGGSGNYVIPLGAISTVQTGATPTSGALTNTQVMWLIGGIVVIVVFSYMFRGRGRGRRRR